jgi:hypothetical protein
LQLFIHVGFYNSLEISSPRFSKIGEGMKSSRFKKNKRHIKQ